VRAHGIETRHIRELPEGFFGEEDSKQLVLTVEYSQAALTALVLHECSHVFEVLYILYSTEFRLDQLRAGSGTDVKKMETSLRELLRLPMNPGGDGEELRFINNLVLLGKAAGNSRLHDVLKKILDDSRTACRLC
jgi:hypothetical protein